MNEKERMWLAVAMFFFGFHPLVILSAVATMWFVERMKE